MNRVGVRTVRRDTAGSGMDSLTSCQANRNRVGVRTVRRALTQNHSLPVSQQNQSENEDSEKGHSCTRHGITDLLLDQ